jgi:hypothetical protein
MSLSPTKRNRLSSSFVAERRDFFELCLPTTVFKFLAHH